jgi:hypothetical protein
MAENTQLRLAYDGGEVSGSSYTLNLDKFSNPMNKSRRDASFHEDSCGLVLNKKIGGGSVHGDHAANADRITRCSLLGS